MKIAVPLLDDRVAPRFGFVDHFLITEILEQRVAHTGIINIRDDVSWSDRLEQLQKLGVTVLLCGGYNRKYVPLAISFGIEVISGLSGNARGLASAFACGEGLLEYVGHRCLRDENRDSQGQQLRRLRYRCCREKGPSKE